MNFAVWHALILGFVCSTVLAHQEALIKNHGKILFFDNTYTLSFHLNLKAYVSNAMVLENSTIKLLNLCHDLPPETNCDYFAQDLRDQAESIQREIKRIRQFSRSKRFAWGVIFRGVAKEVLTLFGVIAITETLHASRMNELNEQIEGNRQLVMAQLNISRIQNEIMADTSKQVMKLHDSIQELNRSAIQVNAFNGLLNIAHTAISNHKTETMKFVSILTGDLRSQFFDLIDSDSLQEEIITINNKLLPKAKLPATNPQDLLDLSKLSSSSNMTHITILVKTPIISNKTYNFFEYIPIPIKTDTTVHILNSNAKYFLQTESNKTKYIPLSSLIKCNTINRRTFCNSIIEEELHDANSCMLSIIANSSNKACDYREISFQNYIMRLSANTIFCFIIKPISIRISCNEKSSIFDLKNNTEINFASHCDLHKISNEFHYDSETFSSVEINYPLIQPNFSVYDTKYEVWSSNISIINRNGIKMLNLNNEIEIIESKITSSDKNEAGFFVSLAQFGCSIFNFISNVFFTSYFLKICIYVVPPVIVYVSIYILCYKLRSFSLQK